MTYWLIMNAALWGGAYWLYRSSETGPRDDFASGILAGLAFALAALSSLAYLATAFWLHRFF